MSNSEAFINLCKQLEQAVETRYGRHASAYHTLMRMQEYRKYWQDIDIIRELRNLYQHNVVEVGGHDAVQITQTTCDTLKKIINEVENPPLVKDIYTKNIVTANMGETVRTVMMRMRENKVSHMPILDERKLLAGVFSKTTLFALLTNGTVPSDRTMEELVEFIGLKNHESESFGFVGLYDSVYEAQKRFAKVYQDGKRLAALYVTEHGKPTEKVIGVITPWDVL